jgi:hypothetical protein
LRDHLLRTAVACGVVTVIVTELLSPFHLLRREPIAIFWLSILLFGLAVWGAGIKRLKGRKISTRPVETAVTLICAVIVAVVAITAWISPPNSADAMAYHLPRVVYWAQAGSIAFFPTPYLNQISLQPLAEYFMLHSYLLSGGDRLVNAITCTVFAALILGVSALAAALGLSSRGQAFAAFCCATLPGAILQASGAKNECMLALWMICAAYFAARENLPAAGFSLGLALATKATAYLFAPPLLLAIFLIRPPKHLMRVLLWLAFGVLLINGPQFVRNFQLSGSPLGYDSAQGDGVFRWRNEHPGAASTVSNLIRHTSEQLGDRSPKWNQAVFHAALGLHDFFGIDPLDPAMTFPGATFNAPVNANHEANANNRWHLLLIVVAAVYAVTTRRRTWILYAAGLFGALLVYCFYLKWQLYMARLELPLFVLAAPLAAACLEAVRPALLIIPLCAFLLSTARLPLLENWVRPLKGTHSLFITARDENYFNDLHAWNNHASYQIAVHLTARSGCNLVGIDINRNQLEYPFQVLLRERNPGVRFVHVGVTNASARYATSSAPRPCAVFCPDCAGVPDRSEMYREIGSPQKIGEFLVFLYSQ